MVRQQALSVHGGVVYDIEVDTAHSPTEVCVRDITRKLLLGAFVR